MSVERVEALEQAILERARQLAEEHIQQGERSRERIVEDSREKIRLLEEKEILAGQSRAEREYRRMVQARELSMQAELDHLRWHLVQSITESLSERLVALTAKEQTYLPLLERLLGDAARAIERDKLRARLNRNDHKRFADRWEALVKDVSPDKAIALEQEPLEASGGVLVSDIEDRILVDNSFEGVIQRLESELQRVIVEHLFPSASRMGIVFNG
jgi:V/A-type H+-transporting ATPase subunit E